MNILVTGATGFIGRHIVVGLRYAGHTVIEGVHHAAGQGAIEVHCNFATDVDPAVWISRLQGVDAVVNAVGIIRESRGKSFAQLHVDAPRALFAACVKANVRKVVQISALGADSAARSRYHLSKAQADRFLASLPLHWVVLQPSVVLGSGGASTRLFATLATLPAIPLPSSGCQRLQPVHIDDVVAVCVKAVLTSELDHNIVPVVGPRVVSLRELIREMRAEMGLGNPVFINIPAPLMRLVARLGRRFESLPIDKETLEMLDRGNVACVSDMIRILGRPPTSALQGVTRQSLGGLASTAADGARLNWLLPLGRVSVALVWIVTGLLSLGIYPVAESYNLLAQIGVQGALASLLLYGGALLDLTLGIATLMVHRGLWVWRAQMTVMLLYTAIITVALPEFWLHPFGPLLKNVPLLFLMLMLHEFERRK